MRHISRLYVQKSHMSITRANEKRLYIYILYIKVPRFFFLVIAHSLFHDEKTIISAVYSAFCPHTKGTYGRGEKREKAPRVRACVRERSFSLACRKFFARSPAFFSTLPHRRLEFETSSSFFPPTGRKMRRIPWHTKESVCEKE